MCSDCSQCLLLEIKHKKATLKKDLKKKKKKTTRSGVILDGIRGAANPEETLSRVFVISSQKKQKQTKQQQQQQQKRDKISKRPGIQTSVTLMTSFVHP